MKPKYLTFDILLMACIAFIIFGCQQKGPVETVSKVHENVIEKGWHKEVKRVGMVIKIKPGRLDEYLSLHADAVTGVRDLLQKYNMRNFSIFLAQLEGGNYYEFGYWEYWGDDFEADMINLNAEPRNQEWLELCNPMQIPLEGETSWKELNRIYFNY